MIWPDKAFRRAQDRLCGMREIRAPISPDCASSNSACVAGFPVLAKRVSGNYDPVFSTGFCPIKGGICLLDKTFFIFSVIGEC